MNTGDRLSALEQDAVQQREQLHATAQALRTKVAVMRDKLLPENVVRNHFLVASGVAAIVGLTIGYLFGGVIVGKVCPRF